MPILALQRKELRQGALFFFYPIGNTFTSPFTYI